MKYSAKLTSGMHPDHTHTHTHTVTVHHNTSAATVATVSSDAALLALIDLQEEGNKCTEGISMSVRLSV